MNRRPWATPRARGGSPASLSTSTPWSAAAPISNTSERSRFSICWKRIALLPPGLDGPFHLHLAIEENRLSIEVRSAANGSSETILLPLAPFRGIVRDYFMVCESYYEAIRRSSLAQIEAIDAGRRSLHDEGSTLLMEGLAEKVVIDHDTARRLFTLLCVLHLRG